MLVSNHYTLFKGMSTVKLYTKTIHKHVKLLRYRSHITQADFNF